MRRQLLGPMNRGGERERKYSVILVAWKAL